MLKRRSVLVPLFSALACSSLCFASPSSDYIPQMYVGVQGGYANTNFSKGDVMTTAQYGSQQITSASVKNHVFAARGYAGYQFNQYLALEMGYLRPRNTRYTNINDGTVPNGYISEYAVDLSGKLFLPMAAYIHFSPYLKLGAAYLDAESHGSITRNGANDFGYSLHPVLGAGIGYNITPSITADVSWTTITKYNSDVPRIDCFFLGLTYHFSFEDFGQNGAHNYGDINGTDP